MAAHSPPPLSAGQLRRRRHRIARIAASLGFVGKVEYRHLYSQTGGAQFGQASTQDQDVRAVYAEAFDRDESSEDFSLEAIIAHERGHQVLARHPRLAKRVASLPLAGEEILASLVGAILCREQGDRVKLFAKAAAELLEHGQTAEQAVRQLEALWDVLVALL